LLPIVGVGVGVGIGIALSGGAVRQGGVEQQKQTSQSHDAFGVAHALKRLAEKSHVPLSVVALTEAVLWLVKSFSTLGHTTRHHQNHNARQGIYNEVQMQYA
jgi:hypothetical protein